MTQKTKFRQTEIGMIPEDWEAGVKFVFAIKSFLKSEAFLLKNDLNERTISHKLAEHFQKEFEDYDVDCEYNRMPNGKDPKEYVEKTLGLDTEKIISNDEKATTVYPDIILHKRGINDNNFLVIEIKKKKYANEKRKNDETYRKFDFRKLRAYTKDTGLKYRYGIYIEFEGSTISELKFFQNGELIR